MRAPSSLASGALTPNVAAASRPNVAPRRAPVIELMLPRLTSRFAPPQDAPLPQPNPEVRHSQVTLKTVFTVSFGVLGVALLVGAIARALVAVTLIGAAATIAIALDHAVVMLVRRRIKRPLAIVIVTLTLLGLVVALGFTLIPPGVDQGKELVADAPHFIHTARGSAIFRTLDTRFHLAAYVEGLERRFPEMLAGAATPILNALGGLLTGVAAVVTISFLVVFMLVFGGRLVRAALDEARPEHLAA